MIELTREEKDILIDNKELLQQNKLEEFFYKLDKYGTSRIYIVQFLIDKLGQKIFTYFKNIPDFSFHSIDFSNICTNGILRLPENIKQIGANSFSYSKGYHTLISPTSKMSMHAFSYINNLKTIIITNGTAEDTLWLDYSFVECSNVKDIYLPCGREEWLKAWNNLMGSHIPLDEFEDEDVACQILHTNKTSCNIHWDYKG